MLKKVSYLIRFLFKNLGISPRRWYSFIYHNFLNSAITKNKRYFIVPQNTVYIGIEKTSMGGVSH